MSSALLLYLISPATPGDMHASVAPESECPRRTATGRPVPGIPRLIALFGSFLSGPQKL